MQGRKLKDILEAVNETAASMPVIFAVHPRTKKQIEAFALQHLLVENAEQYPSGICVVEPQGYLQFLSLMAKARIVFTDSGGIQEETTVLGVPCVTLRENTERPVTLTSGTNVLAGADKAKIIKAANERLNGERSGFAVPELWDGNAASRIVDIIRDVVTRECRQ